MSDYSNWIRNNGSDKIEYQYWEDDYTYKRGVYNMRTGKGIEQVLIVADEYEIDKSEEIVEDLKKYAE
jgi:hypothetical protein